ncbi:ABC transporter transmembrane domain-containing protein [Aquimarina celericrescens]|uniref:ABC transporter transmembrane domain-containing protein n=1 Tax=Aquimarina celericrescens TaxID=1964542 RepID=A0ABW5AZT6_9FLAO|nr:ABC transporter ATP-binding protein [Aquimarina celericrescens]
MNKIKSKWDIIRSFWLHNSKIILGTFLAGICYNVFTILIPISIGKFYEFSFGFSSHRLAAFKFIPFIDAQNFGSFIAFFFALIALRWVFEYLNLYGISLIGERFSKVLREKLFAHQLQIGIGVYDQKGIGKYLLRYSGDLKSIQNYVKKGLIRFSQDVFLLIIVVIVIGYVDINIALIIGGSILFSSFFLWIINKMLYKTSLEIRNARSGMLSFVNTRLRAITALKAFNKYTPEEKRYNKRSGTLYQIGTKYAKITSLLQALVPAFTYGMLGMVMIYIFISSQDSTKNVGGSSLLVLILLIISILPVFRRSLKVSIIWKLGDISFTKLIAIFDLPKENIIPLEEYKAAGIVFQDVEYQYPNSNSPVFKKLNVTLPALGTVLFVGKTGTGKSTLIRLLLKMVSPSKGKIAFGSTYYSSLSEKAIRKSVAVVSKDFPLYGRNVFEAVVYSRNESRRKKAEQLLKKLQQFEGENQKLMLDTPIGDLGKNLTTGQQKIIMYCRALLTEKPILIVENPLKDLNDKTRNIIVKYLKESSFIRSLIIFNDQEDKDFYYTKKVYL